MKMSGKTANNGMINKLMEINQATESYIYNYSQHRDSQIYTAKSITKHFLNIFICMLNFNEQTWKKCWEYEFYKEMHSKSTKQ